MALLAQKLWRIFFCPNQFPGILRQKKVPMATKLRGGDVDPHQLDGRKN